MTGRSSLQCLARLEGFEPPAHGLEVRSSIHLSYRRLANKHTTSMTFRQDENQENRRSPKRFTIILPSPSPAL